jgi:hypothetical protein
MIVFVFLSLLPVMQISSKWRYITLRSPTVFLVHNKNIINACKVFIESAC